MTRGGLCAGIAAAATVLLGGVASATTVGAPVPGGLAMQPPATAIMREIEDFHGFLLWIIILVSVFVLALLLWVIVRYNRSANPTPKRFTHNMTVEVIWTILPVLILVAIAWKSFPLIYKEERIPPAELTLKVVGNSWFWNFEYPDQGVSIAANLLPEEEARAAGRPYLLATTEPLLVPVDTVVRVLVTSNDVIHAFAVPAFGVKEDAIQGRVNETWFNVEREGIYYGQCSELCGINHAYMPIEIHAVSRERFEEWVRGQGGTFAAAAPTPGSDGETGTATEPGAAAPGAPAGEPAAPAAQPSR